MDGLEVFGASITSWSVHLAPDKPADEGLIVASRSESFVPPERSKSNIEGSNSILRSVSNLLPRGGKITVYNKR